MATVVVIVDDTAVCVVTDYTGTVVVGNNAAVVTVTEYTGAVEVVNVVAGAHFAEDAAVSGVREVTVCLSYEGGGYAVTCFVAADYYVNGVAPVSGAEGGAPAGYCRDCCPTSF